MLLLVVEDDPLLAEGLTRTLTHAGHAVEHASSGRRADALLTEKKYDLVVLDIGLPDIDGFEVLRRLRQRRATTSVLVLTARDAIEDRGWTEVRLVEFAAPEFELCLRRVVDGGSNPVPVDERRQQQELIDNIAGSMRSITRVELVPKQFVHFKRVDEKVAANIAAKLGGAGYLPATRHRTNIAPSPTRAQATACAPRDFGL